MLPFPVLSHKRSERKDVINDEIMDLQFELWPTSLVVEVGERLVFEVKPKDPEGVAWFGCFDPVDRYAMHPFFPFASKVDTDEIFSYLGTKENITEPTTFTLVTSTKIMSSCHLSRRMTTVELGWLE